MCGELSCGPNVFLHKSRPLIRRQSFFRIQFYLSACQGIGAERSGAAHRHDPAAGLQRRLSLSGPFPVWSSRFLCPIVAVCQSEDSVSIIGRKPKVNTLASFTHNTRPFQHPQGSDPFLLPAVSLQGLASVSGLFGVPLCR